jgi:hypothetical protein
MMVTSEYLRQHIDALLRLSREIKDPAASAKLQEMADELRIIVSVTDIAGLAADLKRIDIASVPSKAADVVTFKKSSFRGAPARLRSRS